MGGFRFWNFKSTILAVVSGGLAIFGMWANENLSFDFAMISVVMFPINVLLFITITIVYLGDVDALFATFNYLLYALILAISTSSLNLGFAHRLQTQKALEEVRTGKSMGVMFDRAAEAFPDGPRLAFAFVHLLFLFYAYWSVFFRDTLVPLILISLTSTVLWWAIAIYGKIRFGKTRQ